MPSQGRKMIFGHLVSLTPELLEPNVKVCYWSLLIRCMFPKSVSCSIQQILIYMNMYY